MKVVQFIASLHRGGAESVVATLSNAMYHHGVDIELLLIRKSLIATQIDSHIPITYLHFNSRFNPLLYLELLLFFWRRKPDIIHTHSAKATELIYGIHRLISPLHIATKHNARKGKIFNKISHVTAVSKEVQKSITPKQAALIYNGIKPQDICLQHHPKTPFRICAIGRLDPIKAYDQLIITCAKLSFDFQLSIIGEGKERPALERLVQELGLSKKVIFEGYRTDIANIMSQNDLVVISSHSEGFSIVMVESLFYAPLLISTKVSGAVEILTEPFLTTHSELLAKIEDVFSRYDSYSTAFKDISQKYCSSLNLENVLIAYKNYYEKSLQEASLCKSSS